MFFLNVISFPSYFSFLFSHIHVSKKKIKSNGRNDKKYEKKKLDGHYDNY